MAITDEYAGILAKKISPGLDLLEQYDMGKYRPSVCPQLPQCNDDIRAGEDIVFLSAEDIISFIAVRLRA